MDKFRQINTELLLFIRVENWFPCSISLIFWQNVFKLRIFCLFCCFTSQVNSYGHGGTVSSSNNTFFLGRLEQAVNQYFMHILSLVTDSNPS